MQSTLHSLHWSICIVLVHIQSAYHSSDRSRRPTLNKYYLLGWLDRYLLYCLYIYIDILRVYVCHVQQLGTNIMQINSHFVHYQTCVIMSLSSSSTALSNTTRRSKKKKMFKNTDVKDRIISCN